MAQGRMHGDGPQVGVGAKELPEGQQPCLGAPAALGRGERGMPDRPEQHRVGLDHGIRGPWRQRIARLGHARRADGVLRGVQAEAEELAAACSTRSASAVTSGPMPSPGRTAIV